jgi:hypothetical protein
MPKMHWGRPEIKCTVKFTESCNYHFDNAPDRNAINKLTGFCFLHPHYHSYRIGWNVRDGYIQLFAYMYHNFERMDSVLLGDKFIFDVPISCSIRMEHTHIIFDVKQSDQDSGTHISINPSIINLPGIYLNPYFGGRMKAPHDMQIEIY